MTEHLRGARLLIAGLLAAGIPPRYAEGQASSPPQAWTLQTEQPIEWLRFLPSRLLIVSSDDGLRALDPADGSVRWRRDDLGNVSQVSFEAAQQSAPLPGAAQRAPPRAGPVMRLMEELPGGRLIAILADLADRHSWFDVLEVQTGATVWSSTSLPIGDGHGFLAFPDSATLLVHGVVIEPGRRRRVWLRVEAASGRTIWTTDSLLLEPPAEFDASTMLASRGSINGNQPLVALPDSTVALYASLDGMVCFEIPTGRVRWRTPLSTGQLAPIGQGYAPILVSGDTAYLPAGTSVHAIDLTGGHHLWTTGGLPTMTSQMAATPLGLLLRGQPVPPAQDATAQRPFIALVDPVAGKIRWKKTFKLRSGTTPFALGKEEVFMASDEGLVRLSLAEGAERPLTTGKFPGRPVLSLEAHDDAMLVGASQSLTLVGLDGVQRYQTEYPAPTLGIGGRLLRVALGAVAAAGGYYYSGGYLAGTAFAKYQYSTSRFSSANAYFVLKDHNGEGPALAKIDKATGDITAVVTLGGDKTPEYVIDGFSGLLLLKSDRVLRAYRW